MKANDVCKQITDQILSELKQGTIPWEKPWVGGGFPIPRNCSTQQSYSGMNVLNFWMTAKAKGYTSQQWMTFKQAQKYGLHVRKGERASYGVVYQPRTIQDKESGDDKFVPILSTFAVFNLCQIEGTEKLIKIENGNASKLTEPERVGAIERLVASTQARITYSQPDLACYRHHEDDILMPERRRFTSSRALYSVLFHELTHWTGHDSRLGRHKKNRNRRDYAFEELVAELGASFLMATHKFDYSTQHTAYIQNWIKALESDPKHILAASSQAFKAREYILQLEPTATTATTATTAIAPTTNHEAQGTRPEPLLAA